MDWKARLEGLKDSLPEGGEEPVENKEEAAATTKKPRLDIVLDRKGRKGKEATIICGFSEEADEEVAAVATRLKQKLGTGGSARGGEILIQGDKRTQVAALLAAMGYKARII